MKTFDDLNLSRELHLKTSDDKHLNLSRELYSEETEMEQLLKSKLHEYVLEKVKNDEIVFIIYSPMQEAENMQAIDKGKSFSLFYNKSQGLSYGGVKLNYPLADEIIRIAKAKAEARLTETQKQERLSKLTKIALELGFIN